MEPPMQLAHKSRQGAAIMTPAAQSRRSLSLAAAQGGFFDHADRLFHSLASTCHSPLKRPVALCKGHS